MTTHRVQFRQLSPRARGVLKKARYAAYAFVVLLLLAWLALPPVIRWGIESRGSEALGRRMTVESVQFNPFRLSAELSGLRIAEADGQQDWIRLGSVSFNLSLSSLWHRALVLDALRIDQPSVRILRLEGARFNFSDLVERFASAPQAPASEPLHFSVNNIELHQGTLEFDDRPAGRVHHAEAINLGLPFISNLPARVAIDVQPLLEARINGSPFSLKGEVRPFSTPREATLDLAFDALDLSSYLYYIKDAIPLGIQKAVVKSGLHLVWREAADARPASLGLSGTASLSDLVVQDKAGAPLLSVGALEVDIAALEPLANPVRADFRQILLKSPQVDIHRFGNGELNLSRAFAAGEGGKKPDATPAKSGPVEASRPVVTAPAASPSEPAEVKIQRFELQDGVVRWFDEAVPGTYRQTLKDLSVVVQRLDLSGKAPAALTVRGKGEQGESLELNAAVGIKTLQLGGEISAAGLQLGALSPYYQAVIGRARLGGEATLKGRFAADFSKEASALKLEDFSLDLKSFALSDGKSKDTLLSMASFGLRESSLDLARQELKIGALESAGGALRMDRSKTGRINLLDVLQDAAEAEGKEVLVKAEEALRKAPEKAKEAGVAPDGASEAKLARKPAEWVITLGKGQLADWRASLVDRTGLEPVKVELSALGLKIHDWSSKAGSEAGLVFDSLVNGKGTLHADGKLASVPFRAGFNLRLDGVDILAAQPYVDDLYKILITRGQISGQGRLQVDTAAKGGVDVRYAGSLAVDNFNALDRLNETDFMRWKRFSVAGLKFQTQPLTLQSTEVRLNDFFTRLILDDKGRLNVRELGADDEPPVAAASAPASAPGNKAVAVLPPPASPPPVVEIGKIVLADGSIVYSDHFVKPNYEARLMALNGEIGGLSSNPEKLAKLGLKASMDGAAPVNITGTLNPFRQDRLLDIEAQVRDVDLTSASTYAGRYVGYGIDKGKLSMDVHYEIRERRLTASNRVKLDQLTFGDRVESPQATKLPVLFAVSLLKDRNGVIDVNLPISGSLDDPQFSIGSVVLRVITNLISKAVTAPFALLGSAFGGHAEELAFIDFEAGSSVLSAKALKKLADLSKALTDRPSLSLDVSGRADPAADASALKRIRMENAMRALKAEQLVRRGQSINEVASLPISAEEYPVLLKQVYERTKIDARQRNVIGLLKSVPTEEMERLLLGSYVISEEDLQALARDRAGAVRTWLLDQGRIASGRIYMTAAEATSAQDGKSAQARVEFALH
ncbi:DUF748 domain-containing protein [Uliginosibacterium paludis]|uniref:DUF748 domain-containing protein n=1 Tax=Uliginosibacterium paludis TaxID=1615952 RepID=A0ABV2CKS2_9RHOO